MNIPANDYHIILQRLETMDERQREIHDKQDQFGTALARIEERQYSSIQLNDSQGRRIDMLERHYLDLEKHRSRADGMLGSLKLAMVGLAVVIAALELWRLWG